MCVDYLPPLNSPMMKPMPPTFQKNKATIKIKSMKPMIESFVKKECVVCKKHFLVYPFSKYLQVLLSTCIAKIITDFLICNNYFILSFCFIIKFDFVSVYIFCVIF